MSARRPRVLAALAVGALVLGACGGGDDDEEPPAERSTTTTAEVEAAPGFDELELATEEVAVVDTPTALVQRPGSLDLYVAEQGGRVRRLQVTEDADGERTTKLAPQPVLDLTDRVRSGGEQGLLGLAFSSDGRQLYAFATLEPDGRSWLGAFDVPASGRIDPDEGRTLLEVDREHENHNGGQLALGPDGFLYVALGDGGSGGDPDGNGQDTDVLLGKILRIDPEGDEPYGIPPGNPFEAGGGAPEVWLYGARNPWRFSFDRENGDLWVADVGQGEWEEIDRLPAVDGAEAGRGANLGWDLLEGSHPYDGAEPPADSVLPLFEYDHGDGGCAVVGGYVYRGDAIPALQGTYLYTDYCQDGIRGLVGGTGTSRTWDVPVEQVQSFGEDADGEVYLLLTSGEVLRIVEGS